MAETIFLLNVHSDRNSGDLALTRVTVEQLQVNFPASQIVLAFNDPQSYQGSLPTVNSVYPWLMRNDGRLRRLLRLAALFPSCLVPILTMRIFGKPWFGLTPSALRPWIKTYLEADLVVSTAGGFYRSSGKGLTFLLTWHSLALAVPARKPLYIFPQSIGPLRYGWEKTLSRWLFSKARIVMAREPITMHNLRTYGVPPEKCVLLPDVAFGFSGAPREAAEEWLRSHGLDPVADRPLLGVTVINWEGQNREFKYQAVYEAAVKAVIRKFAAEHQGKVLLLPQTWGPSAIEDDRVIARRIVEELPDLQNSVQMIEQPLPAELLQAVFGAMDVLIGTRMHSNIFATSRLVPVIPIGYLHKARGIAEMLGISEWVIDIDQISSEILIEKFDCLWNRRWEVRAHLEETIPEIIAQSRQAGVLVAEDYRKINAAGKRG